MAQRTRALPRRGADSQNHSCLVHGTVEHELVHVLGTLLKGRDSTIEPMVDTWFSEGLAEAAAGGTSGGPVRGLDQLNQLLDAHDHQNPIGPKRDSHYEPDSALVARWGQWTNEMRYGEVTKVDNGVLVFPVESTGQGQTSAGWPWMDTDYFYLVGGGSEGGQQYSWSSNYYLVDTEEAVDDVAFIVNDWTGHVKVLDGERFVRCVSGDEYGINDFVDNGDGTVTDDATGVMWTQDDSGEPMDWEAALAYAEESTYGGYDDWRLPNIKELQSIADYSGILPAVDPVFNVTGIINEAGNADYPYYWSSTSNPYIDPRDEDGYWYAWYLASGYAVDTEGNDTHGAGAVRFDTKTEDGPDGIDAERGENYVRLVRGGEVTETSDGDPTTVDPDRVVSFEDGETGVGGTDGAAGGPEDGAGGAEVPDMAAAEEQLGATEDELIAALGDPSQGQPDFDAAAAPLGVTVEELEAALMDNSSAPDGS